MWAGKSLHFIEWMIGSSGRGQIIHILETVNSASKTKFSWYPRKEEGRGREEEEEEVRRRLGREGGRKGGMTE